jgi:HEXXH motif-containing protein
MNPLFEPAGHWVLPDLDRRRWDSARDNRVARTRGQLAAARCSNDEDRNALDLILAARPATFARLAIEPTFTAWLAAGQDDPLWSGSLRTFALDVALGDRLACQLTVPVDPILGICLPLGHTSLRPSEAAQPAVCTVAEGRITGARMEAERWPMLQPGLPLYPPGPYVKRRVAAIGDETLAPSNPATGAFIEETRAALTALADWAPLHAAEISLWTRGVIALRRDDPDIHVSSSCSDLPGLLFLCGEPSPWVQAGAMVHEAAHQRLEAACCVAPLLLPGIDDAIYTSPWRPDARPIRGVLAGVHAFVAVADMFSHCPDPSPERVEALCGAVASSEDGIAVLALHARWTEEGAALHSALEDALKTTASLCADRHPAALDWARQRAVKRRQALEGPEPGVHSDARLLGALEVAAVRSTDGSTLQVDVEFDQRLLSGGDQAAFERLLAQQIGPAIKRALRPSELMADLGRS